MRRITLILVFCCIVSTLKAQLNYPASKMTADADTYFGTTYKDPYRWIENMKDPDVVGWFKNQADLTNSVMNKVSGRDELIAEWKKLNGLQPIRRSGFKYEAGRYFYRKTMPGEKVGKLYCKTGMNGTEELLFDPFTYIKGKTVTLQDFLPSYDGKMVAISYSHQGAEVATIKVLNLETKKFLRDSIYPTNDMMAWSFDNKSFLYLSIKSDDVKDPQALLSPKTRLHKINTEQGSDIDFFSDATAPELKIDPKEYPEAYLDKNSPNYIYAAVSTVARELKIYYAPISQFNSGKIQWKPLCLPTDKLVRSLEVVGDKVYAATYVDAPNYKVISTSLANPDWAHAETVIPEKSGQSLERVTRTKDYLFLSYSDGINSHIYKYNFKTKATTPIKTPFGGSVYMACPDNTTNDIMFYITSWTKDGWEYNYDVNTDKFTPGSFNKPPSYPAAYNDLIVKEVEVKGHDGAMIPLSIVYKSGIKLDGSSVCLMDAYGAYGISITSGFDMMENALVVKGVVLAIPHVRGGSEKGETWYKAGYKTTKPNTWKDFISCGEYLIANGYTSAGKLAGIGTSAGGILISRSITERPDLFGAAICNVGCANTLRMEFTANGPGNIPEFGTVKDSIECKALSEMDGVSHVVKGTKYPAVICVGGWNDPRVTAWEPGKFAAALQNSTASGKPVLMKVNYDNGHFTEDKDVKYANFADMYAFVLWQCGHPDFKTKN